MILNKGKDSIAMMYNMFLACLLSLLATRPSDGRITRKRLLLASFPSLKIYANAKTKAFLSPTPITCTIFFYSTYQTCIKMRQLFMLHC